MTTRADQKTDFACMPIIFAENDLPHTASNATFPASVNQEAASEGLPGPEADERFVTEIVDDIFKKRSGYCHEISSSTCSSAAPTTNAAIPDKRLQRWQEVLQDRQRLARRIMQKTGKPAKELLFNRATTVDERHKQTLKRVLDYAERMDADVLSRRQPGRLPAKSNACGLEVPELTETLPQAEREGRLQMETVGMSAVAKEEQLGFSKCQGKPKRYSWLRSKTLRKQLEQKFPQIERVLEYMPRFNQLQVDNTRYKGNPAIKREGEIVIQQISSSSCTEPRVSSEHTCRSTVPLPETHAYKVNDQLVVIGASTMKYISNELRFQCEPYKMETKLVLRLENVCKHLLNCQWRCLPYYERGHLMQDRHVFEFENEPFRLLPGQVQQIHARYSPQQIGVHKLRWQLITLPPFFANSRQSVTVRLNGKCKPPPEYMQRLEAMEQQVCAKFKQHLTKSMVCQVAEWVPLLQSLETKGCCLQPYKRLLTERELFVALNPGYKCERLQELEELKALYQRLKRPSEGKWDLRVKTLRSLVLRQAEPQERAHAHTQLLELLESMRAGKKNGKRQLLYSTAQKRNCFLNVRGLIGACIDEWEDMICSVEQVFMATALENYVEEEMEEQLDVWQQWSEEQWHRRICRQKVFLDTAYVQTCAILGQLVENLVAVIEGAQLHE